VEVALAILKIARMGHPVLLQRAEPVADPGAPEIRRLVRDMIETMEDAAGAGLAAPLHRAAPYLELGFLGAGGPGGGVRVLTLSLGVRFDLSHQGEPGPGG
jgi:hypothetical protein